MKVLAWHKRRLRKLVEDDDFRSAVLSLRNRFGLNPEVRRAADAELERRGVSTSDLVAKGWMSALAYEPPGNAQAWTAALFDSGVELYRKSLQAYKRPSTRPLLETRPNEGDLAGALAAAVLTDFDGDEFELFCELVVPVAVKSWSWWDGPGPTLGASPTFFEWRDFAFRPGRVYIDVTFAGLEDVKRYWSLVEAHKRRVKVDLPKRGHPRGAPRRREILDGRTWEEIREDITLTRHPVDWWEHRYVGPIRDADERRRRLNRFRREVRAPLGLRRRPGRRSTN